jgi:hypothetical protein
MRDPSSFARPFAEVDGDQVARELQLRAVKARMEAHRATMQAAGLTAAPPRAPDARSAPEGRDLNPR